MGWWWSSNPMAAPASESAPPAAVQATSTATTPTDTARDAPKKSVSADNDFEALVAAFDKPSTTNTHTANLTPAPKETPTHYVPSPSGSVEQPGTSDAPLDISPEALYPRTMSCRQAFDQAFYCQSLGGKFNDIYRYGELRSCSDNWNAFWFCMRIKALPDLERQERIKEFYQAKDEQNKSERGSSENVWQLRTEPVEKAFWKDPDEVTEKS